MAEREEELKSLLMRVKEESGKIQLKTKYWGKKKDHGIPSHSFWQIEEGKVEMVTAFLFLGSKITADGDCSHEIRRRLLLGRKVMTNLDSVLKIRDITLLTKIHIGKSTVFPVDTYGCELECKEGEATKNRCLQSVVLEKTPASPLDSKEIKPVNLKRNQQSSLGRNDAELKLHYFGYLM